LPKLDLSRLGLLILDLLIVDRLKLDLIKTPRKRAGLLIMNPSQPKSCCRA